MHPREYLKIQRHEDRLRTASQCREAEAYEAARAYTIPDPLKLTRAARSRHVKSLPNRRRQLSNVAYQIVVLSDR